MAKQQGTNGRLKKDALDWAMESIVKHDDNDLFSRPFEFGIFSNNWEPLSNDLAELRLDLYKWSPPRRMLLPKDRETIRRASQLDPLDSLLLTAIIKVLGNRIEKIRRSRTQVFSSRFEGKNYSLYGSQGGWIRFWRKSKSLATEAKFVARSDITDFYNQVDHRAVIEQLNSCNVPDRLVTAISNFLAAFSEKGRGLPIGPHVAHLLAELVLARIDDLLKSKSHNFIRYIDDYHFFCDTKESAQFALMDLAEILDTELGLSLNRVKTSVVATERFIPEANFRLRDEETSENESELIEAIKEVTDSDYDFVTLEEAKKHFADELDDDAVSEVVSAYIDGENTDYPKLAWLLRRLSQVGAPGAINTILTRFEEFVPIAGNAARYIASAGENWTGDWPDIGETILELTNSMIAKRSSYIEMTLLSLFCENSELNHIDQLLTSFQHASAAAKRQLLIAVTKYSDSQTKTWLASLRNEASKYDPWLIRAYIYSLKTLSVPQREKCLEAIDVETQSTEAILLRSLMAERVDPTLTSKDPIGPAWKALSKLVKADRRSFVEERLEALTESLETTVHGQSDQGPLIATWNLRNFGGAAFGFGCRLPEAIGCIGRVLLAFDLVAIQEVQSSTLLDRILGLLGGDWEKLVCGEAIGIAGNNEKLAFLYRKSKVKSLGDIEQLQLSKSDLILSKHQFARPPFLASFKVGEWDLLLGSAHIYFGAKSGEKLKRRIAEITTAARLIVNRANERGQIPFLVGDLNVVGPDDETMMPLKEHRLSLPDDFLEATNAAGDKFYTQIAFLPTHKGPRVKRAGVVKVFDSVFRTEEYERYIPDMKSSEAWETKEKNGSVDVEKFFSEWRTFQISDHYPTWIELH